jgi:hypothetical protein
MPVVANPVEPEIVEVFYADRPRLVAHFVDAVLAAWTGPSFALAVVRRVHGDIKV